MRWVLLFLALLGLGRGVGAEELPPPHREENLSLRYEAELSVEKALGWLQAQQKPDGSWGSASTVRTTAQVIVAFLREPHGKYREGAQPEFFQRALEFLRRQLRPEAEVFKEPRATETLALALQALLYAGAAQDRELVARLWDFLVAQQVGVAAGASLAGGGFRLNGETEAADLRTACAVLETRQLLQRAEPELLERDVDLGAVAVFVWRCQARTAEQGKGGFRSVPPKISAKTGTAPGAPNDAEPSGSSTLAGILALLYSGIPPKEPALQGALAWVQAHYSMTEDPGAGGASRFAYLEMLPKALHGLGVEQLRTADGRTHDWARELTLELVNSQGSAGTWESKGEPPVDSTAAALLALELTLPQL